MARGWKLGGVAVEARVSVRAPRVPLFLRSFLLQAGFSGERLQGLGFAWSIDPALRAAYARDPEGLACARARHLAAFNVQPHAVGVPLGIASQLEILSAAGDASAAARAVRLKSALGAALSGAADAFFWGSLRPLAGALAACIATVGFVAGLGHAIPAGVVLGLAVFNGPALAARWRGLGLGLSGGESAAAAVAGLPVQRWIRAARLAAAVFVFAAAVAALGLPFVHRVGAAAAFAVGAGLSRFVGGPLRLAAAAGLLGLAASAAGWG